MQNVLKQFGGKATDSLEMRFRRARIVLSVVYTAVLALMLFLSSSITYSAFSQRITHRFSRLPAPQGSVFVVEKVVVPTPEEVRRDLVSALVIVNGALLLAAAALGYWLAGLTLRPIREGYERQRRFLGDASHELRTPLAILQVDLENAQKKIGENEDLQKMLTSNLEEVERMSKIVSDLLILSRLDEDAEDHGQMEPLDFREVATEAVGRLKNTAEKQGIALRLVDSEVHDVMVHGDRELLIQAVSNVVKNAILHNIADGWVEVIVTKNSDYATITIRDDGPGISEDHLEKIFDRFYRAEKSHSRDSGGSGLGLSIVQSVMTTHNGSVAIESVVGEGTKVTLTIPIIHTTS